MADGVSLGSANLDLTADLGPLARDLDRAKAKVAAATAEMQAMLDSLHADADVGVGVSHVGSLGGLSAMDRGFSVEHLAATRDLADAFREHTQVTRDLLAAGPAGRSGDTVVTGVGGHTSGIYGVRGASAPGSVSNPIVVVMEAASRTPLGALAAAVGEDTISQGDQRTVVATTQGSQTRVAAAGAPGSPVDRQATDILATGASRGGGGSPNVTPGGHPAEGSPFQALANIEAAQRLAATPSTKPVPVNVTATDPSVTRAESGATARAMADLLAAKQLAPGQRANRDLLEGYPLLGYRVGTSPTSPFPRLYGPGGQVGTTEYGQFPGEGPGALDALLAGRGGGGGGGGLGAFGLGGLFGGGGGGGESTLRRVLYGSSWLPGAAGIGTLGSFAGFGPEHALLTVGGIAGSGVAALGGGALLAGGAAAKLGAGMGADMAVGSSAIADTTSLYKAQSALNDAITAFGPDSKKAAEAAEQLKLVYAEIGHTAGVAAEARLAGQVEKLNEQWDKQTSGARVAFVHLAEPLVEIASKWIPLINTSAEHNFASMSSNLKPFFSYLKGPEAMGIFQQLENEFRAQIPTAMHALDEGFQFFAKTIATVSPLTGGLITDLDHFFTKMDEPAHFAKWESLMMKMIGDFHVWEAFLRELGGALVDLFDKDAKTGESIIEVLTVMLHHVREYEQSVTGGANISNIFEVHREEIIALIKAIAPLGDAFSHVYMAVAPPMVEIVTDLAEGLDAVVKALEKLGTAGEWAVGLTALAVRLKVLVPLLQATKTELLGTATAQGEAAAAASAQARAEALAAGATEEDAAAAASAAAANAGLADAQGAGAAGGAGGLLAGAGKGGLTSLLLRGGLTTGFGLLAAGLVAKATGAKGTLSTSISAAGAGAGFGLIGAPAMDAVVGSTIGGPLGLALGAGLGFATPYAIKFLSDVFSSHAPEYGKKFAAGFTAPLQADLERSGTGRSGSALEKALAQHREATESSRHALSEYGSNRALESSMYVGVGEPYAPGYKKAFNANFLNELREGVGAAELLKKSFAGVAHPTTFAFIQDVVGQLRGLSGESRAAAAEAMVRYAQGLESKGTLPKDAVAHVINSLKAEYPALGAYFKAHSLETSEQVAAAFKLQHAQANISAALEKIRTEWGLFNVDPAVTGKNWVQNANVEMGDFHKIVATSTGSAKQEALVHMHELQGGVAETTLTMLDNVKARFAGWGPAMKAGIGPAVSEAGSELSKFVGEIESAMSSGVLSAQVGSREIGEAFNTYLKALGAGGEIPLVAVKGLFGKYTGGRSSSGEISPLKGAGASGALMQIGQPGTAGHDTVPLNVGGNNIMVGEGEQVAVFNRHQIPIVNAALADMGGLPGLFSQVKTPNYMASGGIVAPAVSGIGALANMVRAGLADVAKAANTKAGNAHPAGGAPGHGGAFGAASASGLPAAARSKLMQIAHARGWDAEAWLGVIGLESGGNPAARNPSGAYGIGQALGATQREFPKMVSSSAVEQIEGMAEYIASRYGNPTAALAHEHSFKWYSHGGLPGFASGGLPHVIGSHAQKTTPVPRNFGQGAHTKKGGANKSKTSKKVSGKVPGIVWPAPVAELEDLINKEIPIASEAYGAVGNEISLHEYGSGELAFILTEGPLGEQVTPYENLANVEGRLGQLHKLANTEGNYHALLEKARGTISVLNGWVATAIKAREELIKKLKERIARLQKQIDKARHTIEENLKEIRTLNASISKVEHHISSLEGHPKKNATAIKSAKAELSKLHSERHGLEAQNKELGGSDTSIGEGGKLHVWEGQREAYKSQKEGREQQVAGLKEHGKTWGEDLTTIQGVGGSGGELGESALTLAKLAKEEEELGVGSMAKALEKAKLQAGPGAGEQELTSLLKQQNEQLAAQFAVSQRQYQVLADLPPFGGSFASGGIVPGPPGAPRLVIAHGGEGIGNLNTKVDLHFANGMEWLKGFVRAEIKQETRNMTRGPSRPIPSRGGGLLT